MSDTKETVRKFIEEEKKDIEKYKGFIEKLNPGTYEYIVICGIIADEESHVKYLDTIAGDSGSSGAVFDENKIWSLP